MVGGLGFSVVVVGSEEVVGGRVGFSVVTVVVVVLSGAAAVEVKTFCVAVVVSGTVSSPGKRIGSLVVDGSSTCGTFGCTVCDSVSVAGPFEVSFVPGTSLF